MKTSFHPKVNNFCVYSLSAVFTMYISLCWHKLTKANEHSEYKHFQKSLHF